MLQAGSAHGTNSHYVHQRCRCRACLAAHAAYNRDYAARHLQPPVLRGVRVPRELTDRLHTEAEARGLSAADLVRALLDDWYADRLAEDAQHA